MLEQIECSRDFPCRRARMIFPSVGHECLKSNEEGGKSREQSRKRNVSARNFMYIHDTDKRKF